jgi:GDP-L-fucose synthase
MNKNSRICVVGDKGTLGRAICKQLLNLGYSNVIGCDLPEVDCTIQKEVQAFFEKEQPEYVFFLAAISAGIEYKRKYPVEMMLKNVQMETNILSAAHDVKCKKLLNVCSALLYPITAEIPLSEEDVTHTNLNEIDTPYSLAKAVGFQLCQYYKREYGDDFFTVVPCNFFGECAAFEGDRAGVVPSLIRRISEAKINKDLQVDVWGTGNACREFLNSKDVADACIYLMLNNNSYDLINIGRGEEFSIRQTAKVIKDVIGYEGELFFDSSKPEGRLHMQLNTDRLFNLGWSPQMDLRESIEDAYEWYETNKSGLK